MAIFPCWADRIGAPRIGGEIDTACQGAHDGHSEEPWRHDLPAPGSPSCAEDEGRAIHRATAICKKEQSSDQEL